MVESFSTGDVSYVAELIAPDYVDHQGIGDGALKGPEGFARAVRAARSNIHSLQVDVEDIFGTDDRAVARLRWIETSTVGERRERETIDIVRVHDGRAIEHWGARA
jgi:predicted SnoaL-like aldol condensation-catalyzing enzyme